MKANFITFFECTIKRRLLYDIGKIFKTNELNKLISQIKGEEVGMNKFLRFALSMLFVCGLLLPIIAGVSKAGNPAYSITEYPSANT
ncbi:MAG: hypothetical protein ACPLKZ_08125, partial [Candidatus Bathyarchaeales archaeon]